MKTEIKYTFDDDDPEDKLNRIVHADDAYFALYEINDHLRSEYKYNEKLSEEVIDYIQTLREKFYEIMESKNVDLNRDFQ